MTARAIAIALALAGCGLLPEEDLTGRRIGDGVAPWQDLGPLPLCLGTRHVGPPGSVVGGFCQPDDTPPQLVCDADADCAARERCVCGRCTVQFCTSASECGAEKVCIDRLCSVPCAGDADCGGGETCLNGGCRGACQDSRDCLAGEVCSTTQRRCIVDDCVDETGCPATDFCDVQREPRDVAEPTVLARAGGFTMWLEMSDANPADRAIWRAVSSDGLAYRLDPAVPVLEAAGDAHAPAAVDDQRGCLLYYETAGGIWETACPESAGSDPGRLVLAGDYHAPAAAAGDDRLFVTIGARTAIGTVQVPPAGPAGAPEIIYTPADVIDPVHWRDVQQVGSPFVLVENGFLLLWFDAFGSETRDVIKFGLPEVVPPNDSIGFASAPASAPLALVSYPYNPIFDRPVLFADHQAERAPAVARVPGSERWLLYYEGLSADGTRRQGIGVAGNPPR